MKTAVLIMPEVRSREAILSRLRESHSVDLFESEVFTEGDPFSCRYDLYLVEINLLDKLAQSILGQKTVADFLKFLKKKYPSSYFVVLADQDSYRRTFEAIKAGADNYLSYPIDYQEMDLIVQLAEESVLKDQELQYLRGESWQEVSSEIAPSNSPLMKSVYEKIAAVASTKTTVLLTGESGTGKTLAAKLLHRLSNRSDKQFISVHCGAIPETLVESELFGHEKGSFTGADRKRIGKFEIANEGTLFLDEIGTISAAVQIKLLQVLQEKQFNRVGADRPLVTDVRIITATNSDLEELCEKQEFRKDLYYRLNVFPIEIPPLRKRLEDIPMLVSLFLDNLNGLYAKNIASIDSLVLEAFQTYHWPGNIRELENLMERAYIIETSDVLRSSSFPGEIFSSISEATPVPVNVSIPLREVRKEAIERVEMLYLKELLTANHGKINATAEQAGITPRQLHKLMAKYRIRKEEFK